jgi:DNA-binding transcriptional MerR regulator
MRIGELSRTAGVPVPTIKYYLREGLLPPGDLSSPNQASYGPRHVERLRLVRALLEVGRLPIAAIRDVVADLDRPDPDVHHLLGRALKPTAGPRQEAGQDALATADRETDDLVARRGWQVGEHAPARRAVAEAIAALHQLGLDAMVERIDGYAEAAERIAALDLGLIGDSAEPAAMVHDAVVGTIVGDALLAGLRRLAQEDASAHLYGLRTGRAEDGATCD